MLTIVREFSNDIGKDVGIEKYGKTIFLRGKLRQITPINLDTDAGENYIYLVINEGNAIPRVAVKDKIRKK